MTPERWRKITAVFHDALARDSIKREAFLEEACVGDRAIRAEVEQLLVAHDKAGQFGEVPLHAAFFSEFLPLTVAPGTMVGAYEVIAPLGCGGMGEVYRALDTKLQREVALKVLPLSFAGDAQRLARFRREAQVLASLNHAHIGAIYGLEETGVTSALVLELVEGPTLADRILQGPIPTEEAWCLARQIAQALEAAHEHGIIHRDLKPANIKIKYDGTVKVLDFGLAKALESSEHRSGLSSWLLNPAPDITDAGVLLGTPAYMSPELANARPADKGSDIWGFGCVLYEMLTGKRAFDPGDSTALGAIMASEPDWHALPSTIPPCVLSVLKRCLQKDPNLRMRDIADARFQIEEGFTASDSSLPLGAHVRTRFAFSGWIAAALVAIVAAIIILSVGRSPAEPPETRLEIMTPPADDPFSLAMSPDGRSVVFQARVEGRGQLWLRSLESEKARPLAGTERAIHPFWSPDSRSVAFFADGVLKRFDLEGGFVRTVANAPHPRRGAWNGDGTILFGASIGPLYRVSADGGEVKEATNLLAGQTNHRFPHFLPDGRGFLLFALGASSVRGVYLGSLTDKSVHRVMDRESAYSFMSPAHVLLARQGALWARKLNSEGVPDDEPFIPVAPEVLVAAAVTGWGAFSSSSMGSIAYRASAGNTQLVWLDRAGRPVGALGQPDDTQLTLTHLSADGRTVATYQVTNGNTDVWLTDAKSGISRRLTFDSAVDGEPIVSHDGSRVVYVSDGKADVWDIYERRSDGTGTETLVFESGENKNPRDWSPDGNYILYASQNPETDWDLWALPLIGERKPVAVARTRYAERGGRFSPDGRWVAYTSTETGRPEIYLQPFPGPGAKLQISVGGGTQVRWRRDGRELFYVAPDNSVMAVSVAVGASSVDAAAPRALFTLPTTLGYYEYGYEPSPDGQRFLVTPVMAAASPITVILNWKPPGP